MTPPRVPPHPEGPERDTGVGPPLAPTRPVVLPGDPGTEAFFEFGAALGSVEVPVAPGAGTRPAPAWLRAAVLGLAALLLLALAGLILDEVRPSLFQSLRARPARAAAHPSSGSANPGADRHGAGASSTSTSLAAGGLPRISSLQPASAAAGAQIVVLGSGFHSANGHIVATFDGSQTATRCPSSGRCVATVPAGPKRGAKLRVRVETETGRSNAVIFTYR